MKNDLSSTDHIELQALFFGTETEKGKFSLPHIQNKTNEHKIKEKWRNRFGITTLEFNVLQQCQNTDRLHVYLKLINSLPTPFCQTNK